MTGTARYAVGHTLAPRTIGPVTRTDIVRYAGASGDFNPIHHDEPFALSAGFPSVFAMGMYSAGLLGTYLTDEFPPSALKLFRVRFKEQVWPGDVLECSGTITVADGADVTVDLTCTRQTGGTAVQGTAVVSVAP
ncbi:MaoC/PaaZ C-terminal domain-containing protein [Actinomadura roseirufa]|uniref:MaoC/PaaZ C-terminal domain-containing protein n=1 Tax=Actinomadura roseirufa TaxID=2094049 RepID=UPI001041B2C2|nr:MaoC/PaaZ C-terminal domain-containing protein [Actinomadura roseirufa]